MLSVHHVILKFYQSLWAAKWKENGLYKPVNWVAKLCSMEKNPYIQIIYSLFDFLPDIYKKYTYQPALSS